MTPRARRRLHGRLRRLLPAPLLLLLPLPGALAPTGAGPLAAQETIREEQLPLAPSRSVVEIDPDLRRELGLFPEVQAFTGARLFRTDAGRLILEVSARRDGTTVRERRSLTPDELEAFRAELDTRFADAGRSGAVSREGRGGLVLGQTLLGLGFYSWAVPTVLDLDGDRAVVATSLLTAGASFYLPYRITRSIPVTDTHRNLALWGGTRGILYGYLASSAASGIDDDHDRLHLGAAVAGSVAGSVAGYHLARAVALDEGTGTLWTTMADVGALAGLGAAQLSGFFDEVTVTREADTAPGGEPVVHQETRSAHPRAARLTVLAGVGTGLAAGRWLGGRSDWSVGDAFGLRSTTALGGQLLLPLAELLGDDGGREDRYAAALLLGGIGGIAAGERLFRRESFSGSDGLLVNAGHLAGGLTALGLTWLAVGDDAENELLYLTTTALGSAAGFTLTYRALSRAGFSGSATEPQGPRAPTGGGGEIRFHPSGLTAALLRGGGLPGGNRSRTIPPLISIRF